MYTYTHTYNYKILYVYKVEWGGGVKSPIASRCVLLFSKIVHGFHIYLANFRQSSNRWIRGIRMDGLKTSFDSVRYKQANGKADPKRM